MFFSVVISVYKNDYPDFVGAALDSILVNQIRKPNEVVLVQDGPVPDALGCLLAHYEHRYADILHIIRLRENKGLGNALRIAVDAAKYDYIARMDSDDICAADRFEKQLDFLSSHTDVDIVGGQMTEFIGSPDDLVGRRIVPLGNDEIYKYMKHRCALNHVTVMFRKNAVLKVGNYQDWFWNEDYYLWIRMMFANCRFANLPDVLVNVRTGADQYARRGGRKYFDSEKGIKKLQLTNKMITPLEYIVYVVERFVLQVMMPNKVRGFLFRWFAREK